MSIFSQFKCVLVASEFDAAIDENKMFPLDGSGVARADCDGIKYLATREERFVHLHEGKQATWFVLKPVKARALNAMVADINKPTPSELWSLAQACIVNVENSELTLAHTDFRQIGNGDEKRLSDDAMERIAEQWSVNAIRELGTAVLVRARLSKEKLTSFLSRPG